MRAFLEDRASSSLATIRHLAGQAARLFGRHRVRLPALALAVFVSAPAAVLAQPSINIAPAEVRAGTAVTLTVTASGGFDLSHVGPDQIVIHPSGGIGNLQAIPSPTAPSLRVEFSLDATATPGARTLIIIQPGNVVASAVFSVAAPLPLQCPVGQRCCRFNPVTHNCLDCETRCPLPRCPIGQHCCHVDPNNPGHCDQCLPNTQNCPPPPN
jgi:hypothetical protein